MRLPIFFYVFAVFIGLPQLVMSQSTKLNPTETLVKYTSDFELNGNDKAWDLTPWIPIPSRRAQGKVYETKAKILYSNKGIYCLYFCEDQTITATLTQDNTNLYNEDVVEFFIWPNESSPIYFEYELSPLNYELPILVPNYNGDFLGWLPWHYEGEKKTRHAVSIQKDTNGKPISWTAEFFIPYPLLKPLRNVPPTKGTKWRANMYRLDYDTGKAAAWSWQPTRKNFHDYESFGTLIFE